MSALIIQISDNAADWIARKLQTACENPRFLALVPALYLVINYKKADEEGRVFEACASPFFDIGWFSPQKANTQNFVELLVRERRLYAVSSILGLLKGKQLVLETFEVGYPIAADVRRQFLNAIPCS